MNEVFAPLVLTMWSLVGIGFTYVAINVFDTAWVDRLMAVLFMVFFGSGVISLFWFMVNLTVAAL